MSSEDWTYVADKALKLFAYGQNCSKHNLILVDKNMNLAKIKRETSV